MKILFFVFLIQGFICYPTNGTKSIETNFINAKLDALFDHECRDCAHDFNDSGFEQGRLVTVLPVVHPTYKLSLEFYLWGYSGSSWDNVFLFTKTNSVMNNCDGKQFGLWVQGIAGDPNKLRTNIDACVNGIVKVVRTNTEKDRWHSLEYVQFASRTDNTDLIHHYYVKLNGEIVHEEVNLEPRTFQDVKVYLSNPWDSAAYGVIRQFKYRKYDDFCLNYCP